MKTYQEKVLTVIAICLVIQTFGGMTFIEDVYAKGRQTVAICNVTHSRCVDTVSIGGGQDALLVKIVI